MLNISGAGVRACSIIFIQLMSMYSNEWRSLG